jgi:acylglycerol lipase
MNNFTLFNNKFKLNVVSHELKDPKAILINLHGYGMHFQCEYNCIETLQTRIDKFSPLKILCYGLELRGHGKSDGLKFHVHDYNDYIMDIHTLVLHINNKYPLLPIYMLGESMGAALSIIYSIKYNITGIILLGPMLDITDYINPILINIIMLISYIVPKWKIVQSSNNNIKLQYKNYKNKCTYTSIEPAMLSTSRECYKIINWIKQNTTKFTTPVLALHSIDDPVTSHQATIDFIKNCKSTDKKFISIPGYKHSLLSETNTNMTLLIVYEWFENKI